MATDHRGNEVPDGRRSAARPLFDRNGRPILVPPEPQLEGPREQPLNDKCPMCGNRFTVNLRDTTKRVRPKTTKNVRCNDCGTTFEAPK